MGRHDFLYGSDLPHRAVAVYLYLQDKANKKGECWPSLKTIAESMKISKSTVRRALKDLKKKGLVESKQRYRPNGGKSSMCYTIRPP